jgi:hypothetical protein
MSGNTVLDPNAETAVSTKLVLKLIQAHLEPDNQKFKEVALEVAEELRLNGKHELYQYILAQYGLVRTFEVTD